MKISKPQDEQRESWGSTPSKPQDEQRESWGSTPLVKVLIMDVSRPARILIAEDNPQGAELLEAFLADSEYEVKIAADGDATLRLVKDWQPDLVLLDVMMPKISGFEVCKRLKSSPATRGIVVLMVTALDQPHDIDRAVEAGTNDFLTKPINKTELLRRIHAALKSRCHAEPLEQTIAYIEGVQAG